MEKQPAEILDEVRRLLNTLSGDNTYIVINQLKRLVGAHEGSPAPRASASPNRPPISQAIEGNTKRLGELTHMIEELDQTIKRRFDEKKSPTPKAAKASMSPGPAARVKKGKKKAAQGSAGS